MTDKEKLSNLWNSINSNSVSQSKEIFERNIDVLVEFLIYKTLDQEKFEIGFCEEGRQGGSFLQYKSDQKELELRLKKNDVYEILLSVIGPQAETHIFKSKVSSEAIKLIPETIKKLMYKVNVIERSMTFFNSLIE